MVRPRVAQRALERYDVIIFLCLWTPELEEPRSAEIKFTAFIRHFICLDIDRQCSWS